MNKLEKKGYAMEGKKTGGKGLHVKKSGASQAELVQKRDRKTQKPEKSGIWLGMGPEEQAKMENRWERIH